MNPDKQYSSCDDKQEDYSKYENGALKYEMKYIASDLNVGTLVWTKLTGYERWPAVVLPDANYENAHIWKDIDGEPLEYHVEYLGKCRSRGWVTANNVELYRKVACKSTNNNIGENGLVDDISQTLRASITRRRKGSKQKAQTAKKKLKSKFKGGTVQDAIDEANSLLDLLPHQRLASCTTQRYLQLPATSICNSSTQVTEIVTPHGVPKKSKVSHKAKSADKKLPMTSNSNSQSTQSATLTACTSHHKKVSKVVARQHLQPPRKEQRNKSSHDVSQLDLIGPHDECVQSGALPLVTKTSVAGETGQGHSDAVVPSCEGKAYAAIWSSVKPLPPNGCVWLYTDHSPVKMADLAHDASCHIDVEGDEFLTLSANYAGQDTAETAAVPREDVSTALHQLTAAQQQLCSLAHSLALDAWLS